MFQKKHIVATRQHKIIKTPNVPRFKMPVFRYKGSVLENDFWTPPPGPLLSILYMTFNSKLFCIIWG